MQEMTVYNVESFFGWTINSKELVERLKAKEL